MAPNIKTPHRCIKMANRAYSRKAPGIHQEQRKTPHSVSNAGQGYYFCSFARSSSSKIGCNRIYSKIKGGTSVKAQLQRRTCHNLARNRMTQRWPCRCSDQQHLRCRCPPPRCMGAFRRQNNLCYSPGRTRYHSSTAP